MDKRVNFKMPTISAKQKEACKTIVFVVLTGPFFYRFVESESHNFADSLVIVAKFIVVPAAFAAVLSHYLFACFEFLFQRIAQAWCLYKTKDNGVDSEDNKKNKSKVSGADSKSDAVGSKNSTEGFGNENSIEDE